MKDKELTEERALKCDALDILLDELQEDILILKYKLGELKNRLKKETSEPMKGYIPDVDLSESQIILDEYERGKSLSQKEIGTLIKTLKFYRKAAEEANERFADILRLRIDGKIPKEVRK